MRNELSDAVESLIHRYATGERVFTGLELDDADLSGVNLAGATFHRCYLSATFRGACLRDVVFHECNVKSADLRDACLRNASFPGSGVCAIMIDGANLEGASFAGAYYHGHEIKEGDFP